MTVHVVVLIEVPIESELVAWFHQTLKIYPIHVQSVDSKSLPFIASSIVDLFAGKQYLALQPGFNTLSPHLAFSRTEASLSINPAL